MSQLKELNNMQQNQLESLCNTRGMTSEWYMRRILSNGDINKFKKLIGDEVMNHFEKVVDEQSESLKSLTDKWGLQMKNLKSASDGFKKDIKQNVSDIKDYADRLRLGVDKFNSAIDDKKLKDITESISKITECLSKLCELETSGKLDRLKSLLK